MTTTDLRRRLSYVLALVATALLVSVTLAWGQPDPTTAPAPVYVPHDTSRPPFYYNWNPIGGRDRTFGTPAQPHMAGIRPEHRIVDGDRQRPGETHRCRVFWKTVDPEFTLEKISGLWTREWRAFYDACDARQQSLQ